MYSSWELKKLLIADNEMLISVPSPPVRHQTTRSEEPFVARGWMGQAWCKQPAAPRCSVGAQQVQHRACLLEVLAISCLLGK